MPPKAQPTPVATFEAQKYTNKNMDTDTVLRLKEVFDLFDADHSGLVSISEIQDVIQVLGIKEEAKSIIKIIESSGSGDVEELDFATFVKIFGYSESQDQASLQQLYEVFDPNNTNCFGPEDFERVCEMVGERFTPQEVDQMIDYADKDRDGGISLEEFVSTVTRQYPKV